MRAQVTPIRIRRQRHVTVGQGPIEQATGAGLHQGSDDGVLSRIKGSPYLIQWSLGHVTDDDPAARAAKDVAQGIHVYALGTEEGLAAIEGSQILRCP